MGIMMLITDHRSDLIALPIQFLLVWLENYRMQKDTMSRTDKELL